MSWSIHLCPDAEDLGFGYNDGKRPILHWNRIHINTPWFHIATAITRSGRFSRCRQRHEHADRECSFQHEWIWVRRQ